MHAQIAGRTPILDYRRDENRTFSTREFSVVGEGQARTGDTTAVRA